MNVSDLRMKLMVHKASSLLQKQNDLVTAKLIGTCKHLSHRDRLSPTSFLALSL